MLRDIVRIFRDPLAYLSGIRAEFGPVVAFPTQPTPAWLVDDPDAVDRVLRTNAGNYTKQTVQYGALSLLTGDGLLTADNPGWLPRRRQVGPAFHRRTLDRLVGCVAAAADGLDAELAAAVVTRPGTRPGRLSGPTRVDIDGPLMHATLDVVSRGLFSAELGARGRSAARGGSAASGRSAARGSAAAGPDIAGAVLDGLEEVLRRATRPLHAPRSWPTPGNRRLNRSLATLDAAVDQVVTSRAGAPAPAEPDVLDLLLASVDDPRGVRDEAVTLVVAGHETVASAMEWAAHLLATHPDVQERVAAEAAAVLGGPGTPTLADVARLPLARAVLDETLRLYPPAWVVTRRATADDELAGHRLPAGTLVIVSPWVRHRDAGVWDDPAAFDPGRFLGADPGAGADGEPRTPRPTAAYLPFGIGPRLCIGRDFALLEATVLLARLTLRWRLAPVPGHPVAPSPRVTVRPRGGLPLLVSPR